MKTTVNNTTQDLAEQIASKILLEKTTRGEDKYFKRETSNGFEIFSKSLMMDVFLKEGKFEYAEEVVFRFKKSKSGKLSFVIDDSIASKW